MNSVGLSVFDGAVYILVDVKEGGVNWRQKTVSDLESSRLGSKLLFVGVIEPKIGGQIEEDGFANCILAVALGDTKNATNKIRIYCYSVLLLIHHWSPYNVRCLVLCLNGSPS